MIQVILIYGELESIIACVFNNKKIISDHHQKRLNKNTFHISDVYASPLGHVSIDAMEQKSIIAHSGGSNQSGSMHHHLDLKLENS